MTRRVPRCKQGTGRGNQQSRCNRSRFATVASSWLKMTALSLCRWRRCVCSTERPNFPGRRPLRHPLFDVKWVLC